MRIRSLRAQIRNTGAITTMLRTLHMVWLPHRTIHLSDVPLFLPIGGHEYLKNATSLNMRDDSLTEIVVTEVATRRKLRGVNAKTRFVMRDRTQWANGSF